MNNQGVNTSAWQQGQQQNPAGNTGQALNPGTTDGAPTKPTHEFRVSTACESVPSGPDEGTGYGDGNCDFAQRGCSYENPPSDRYMQRYWSRPIGSTGPWTLVGNNCNPSQAPAGAPAPPPVPTVGQINAAFAALPFAKPTVAIQPVGNVTLVNLPTYYEATWPGSGLKPGDISNKVQLLSWSIEFRIDPATYRYDFGDGEFSKVTKDLGGPYPDGKIRHTYTKAAANVPVKVDAAMTGAFRVNGGPWQDLDTVAELENEPVTTLQVRTAKARLYNNG